MEEKNKINFLNVPEDTYCVFLGENYFINKVFGLKITYNKFFNKFGKECENTFADPLICIDGSIEVEENFLFMGTKKECENQIKEFVKNET